MPDMQARTWQGLQSTIPEKLARLLPKDKILYAHCAPGRPLPDGGEPAAKERLPDQAAQAGLQGFASGGL